VVATDRDRADPSQRVHRHHGRVAQPDLGREHFDGRARAELAGWPDEELFSNQTLFVLPPRTAR